MLITFLKGIVVGLVVSIPVGPVGLFCLERTTTQGWKTGLSSVIIMAVADVCSAVLVLFGMALLDEQLKAYGPIIRVCTGLLFAALGVKLILTRNKPPKEFSAKEIAATGITTFLLSISPATLALMILLFPIFKMTAESWLPLTLAGVLCGSGMWGSAILLGGHHIGKHIKGKVPVFKLVAGCIFTTIGIASAILAIL